MEGASSVAHCAQRSAAPSRSCRTPVIRYAVDEDGPAPTLYGPLIGTFTLAVIFHACCMPTRMMIALISPEGMEPAMYITGRAKRKRKVAPSAAITPGAFEAVVGAAGVVAPPLSVAPGASRATVAVLPAESATAAAVGEPPSENDLKASGAYASPTAK